MYKHLALAALFLLIGVNANATNIKHKPYLGGSANLYSYSFYGVEGLSIYGGYRWDCLSLELGFSKPANESWNDDESITFKSNNVYIDGIFSHPLTKSLEAQAIVGLGIFHTKTYGNSDSWLYPTDSKETSAGFRAGIGLQYNFNQNWATDISYRFQTNCNVFIGYMSIYSVGLRYYFG